MVTATELQTKIINLIRKSDDVEQLASIYRDVQSRVGEAAPVALPWDAALVDIKPHLSFDALIEAQGEKSISFEEFRQLSEAVAWDDSLEDILALLKP